MFVLIDFSKEMIMNVIWKSFEQLTYNEHVLKFSAINRVHDRLVNFVKDNVLGYLLLDGIFMVQAFQDVPCVLNVLIHFYYEINC